MKAKARRFDWYPGDYLAGTAGLLTLEEHGAYILVLNWIYESDGGAWREDAGHLAWFTRGQEEAARRILDALVEKGKLRRVKRSKGTFLTNNRASAEVQRTIGRIEAAKTNANKRWKSDQLYAEAYATAHASALPGQKLGNASSHQPSTISHQPEESSEANASSDSSPQSTSSLRSDVDPPTPSLPSTRDLLGDRTAGADLGAAVEAWNETAVRAGLARVQRLTDARRRALNRRLSEAGGIEGWRAALAKLEGSKFLTGSNDRGWRADFDFVVREAAFTRLMEGKYDDREPREAEQFRNGFAQLLAESRTQGR